MCIIDILNWSEITLNVKKRPTIRDVAKLANVSVATVSRYLNGKTKKMTSETAQTIADAIEKLKYVPNSAAREMAKNKSKIIAIVIANLADYFSTEIFKGASYKLEEAGYVPVLLDTGADQNHEKQVLNSINLHGFDGLILQPLTSDTELIKSKLTREFPVVVLDRKLKHSPWPEVVTNNSEASKNATQYFFNHGFKHIVVLSSTIQIASTRSERLKGIKEVTSNIDIVEIDESNFDRSKVYNELVNALKSNEKTLLFSLKERWLLEFLPQLMKDNVLNEQNYAVTGFADTQLINGICPYAKVISQNPSFMGEKAAEILLAMLNDEKKDIDDLVINATLKK